MMKCDHVIERLWAFVDGELPAAEEESVREHLEQCGRCFPKYDWHRAYARYVHNVAGRMADPALRRRVFQTLLLESKYPGSTAEE
jgi:anti-sigma factor (TIGR02949 family)